MNLKEKASILLKEKGLRCTEVRLLILQEFLKRNKPLSIQDFKKDAAFRDWDDSSTYRNFTKLEEVGIIRAIPSNSEFQHYESTLETKHHHHHITCRKCKTIQCLNDCSVEEQLTKMANKVGFSIEGHTLELYGLCSDCKKD